MADTKALAPADAPVFNLTAVDADLGGTIAEEMDGLGSGTRCTRYTGKKEGAKR